MRRLIARRLAPMRPDRPGEVLRDRAILVDDAGMVTAVVDVAADFDGETIALGDDVLVLPGLVNAHTHLELSNATPAASPGHLAEWLTAIVRSRQTGDSLAHAADAAQRGAAESLAFGVTTVGDITRFPAATRPALRDGPLRVVSFGEVQAMAARRGLLGERLAAATDASHDSPTLTTAVSPHAPYTVEEHGYDACLAWAERARRPICTHLAEAAGEEEFLRHGNGPYRELWEAIDAWSDDVPTFNGSPLDVAKAVRLLDAAVPSLLAHVNHLDDRDLDLLASGDASVAYCPRTHAYFGHPSHRFEAMLARGVNVCLATDSKASSPDLNLVAELRHVRRERPHLDAATLWSMATWRPAAALGLAGKVGQVTPGAHAHLAVFPDPGGDDPLASVLNGEADAVRTLIAGRDVDSSTS